MSHGCCPPHPPIPASSNSFDQSDLDSLGTANTSQNLGWKYVAQPLVSEQVLDDYSPEQFPSFLFGLPTFNSHGGFGLF